MLDINCSSKYRRDSVADLGLDQDGGRFHPHLPQLLGHDEPAALRSQNNGPMKLVRGDLPQRLLEKRFFVDKSHELLGKAPA